MIALLSPAKSMDFNNPVQTGLSSQLVFEVEAAYLANKLQKMSVSKLEKLMHVSADLAGLNHERYQQWQIPRANDGASKEALLAFTGEAYRGLDAASLSKKELTYLQEHLIILSGLYGVLRPMDLMMPYRLEMGTKWQITGKQKNLYIYWKDKVTGYLNDHSDGLLVNIASNEYFKVIDKKQYNGRIITCEFKDKKGGEYKAVMTWAKHARGAMARFMAQHQIKDPEHLKGFDLGGYLYNKGLSSENSFVFTRG